MSIKRVVTQDGRTRGWQAYQYTVAPRYLSAFFADRKHGGTRAARALAAAADLQLERQARRVRRLACVGLI